MDPNKTPDELREELYKKLASSQGSEIMHEIAMPGVRTPVDTTNI